VVAGRKRSGRAGRGARKEEREKKKREREKMSQKGDVYIEGGEKE